MLHVCEYATEHHVCEHAIVAVICSILISLRVLYQAGLVGHCILEFIACSDGGMKDSSGAFNTQTRCVRHFFLSVLFTRFSGCACYAQSSTVD